MLIKSVLDSSVYPRDLTACLRMNLTKTLYVDKTRPTFPDVYLQMGPENVLLLL